jgi:hypothetical protein
MRIRITAPALALALAASIRTPCPGGSIPADFREWSSGTACLLPAGRREIGLFQSFRWGISESLEFSTHPLACFLIPNLALKWSHGDLGAFQVATRHSVVYPTLLMRTVSREGIGGLISPEFKIPHMVSIYNEMVFSKPLTSDILFTAKAGVDLAVRSGPLDDRTTIDLPFAFPRLNVYYHGYGFRGGGGLRGPLLRRWRFDADVDAFYYPSAEQAFAFEQRGLILWSRSSRFQACIGYALSYCEYPFGAQWHLMLPLMDFTWGWQAGGH